MIPVKKYVRRQQKEFQKLYKIFNYTMTSNVMLIEYSTICNQLLFQYNVKVKNLTRGFRFWRIRKSQYLSINAREEWTSSSGGMSPSCICHVVSKLRPGFQKKNVNATVRKPTTKPGTRISERMTIFRLEAACRKRRAAKIFIARTIGTDILRL